MAQTDDASPRSDARWIRAHAALRDAALRMASERPIDRLSLAALATAAGVSRSTAYEHAATVRELVEEALVEELDALRERHLVGISADETASATAATTRDVIEHVERHSGIYRLGLAPNAGAGSLHGMLSQHFAESVQLLLDEHDLDPGVPARNPAENEVIDGIVVRGIADGTVGQIAAWIAHSEPRDRGLFLAVNEHLLPEWMRGSTPE